MPLLKNLDVDVELCADSYRRKDFVLQHDYIRRMELGKEVSIRAASLKGAVVIETLRKISEEDVTIGNYELEAYADAEDWLCRKMRDLFQTVRHLGMQPRQMNQNVALMLEGEMQPLITAGKNLCWIPVSSFYVGDERVYLFRAAAANYAQSNKLNMRNTGVIGYTREYLNTVSPELANYIAKLESKAMDDPEVRAAFTRLGSILRPKAYKEEQLLERAKEYEKVESFGGWA
jgi:hypothetical protein